jgi:hypothetical protein
MNESKERLTLKHIVDFYIWTGTSNKKTKVVVSQKNNSIFIGKNQITKENLDKEMSRDTFVNFMTNAKNNNEGKRRHIQFKKTKGNRALNFENRKYVEYLINKSILNTNVNTKEDTFIGDTSIYLSTNLNTGTSKPKSTPKKPKPAKKETSRSLSKEDIETIKGSFNGIFSKSKLSAIRQFTDPSVKNTENVNRKEFFSKYDIIKLESLKEKVKSDKERSTAATRYLGNFNGVYFLYEIIGGKSYTLIDNPSSIVSLLEKINKDTVSRNKDKFYPSARAFNDALISEEMLETIKNSNNSGKVENNDGKDRNSEKDSVPLPQDDVTELTSKELEQLDQIDNKARIENNNKFIEDKRNSDIRKLRKKSNLLAYHYLVQKIGIQNPYGSDTSMITAELKLTFKEAENLVKERMTLITPEGRKFGDPYNTSKLDKQVSDILNEKAPTPKKVVPDNLTKEEYKEKFGKLFTAFRDTISPTKRSELFGFLKSDSQKAFTELNNYLVEEEKISKEEIENICKLK